MKKWNMNSAGVFFGFFLFLWEMEGSSSEGYLGDSSGEQKVRQDFFSAVTFRLGHGPDHSRGSRECSTAVQVL